MWQRILRLFAWLAEDADQMWKGASLAHVYEENQRRIETGRLTIRP